jgi:hypothetical protein
MHKTAISIAPFKRSKTTARNNYDEQSSKEAIIFGEIGKNED